jgi:hypothetical protein
MDQVLINKDTAKMAMDLGYNEYHADFYIDKKKNGDFTSLPAVPQSMLQTWLRDNHNIDVTSIPTCNQDGIIYLCMITIIDENGRFKQYYLDDDIDIKPLVSHIIYDTYELALEDGLQHALKLINK